MTLQASKGEPPVSSTPWGPPPKEAHAWQVHRQQGDKWARCSWFNAATTVADYEFPLALLSPDRIVKRWGSGVYRLQWMGQKEGKAASLGKSKAFQFDVGPSRPLYPNPPSQEVAAEVVAVPSSPAPKGEMSDFERMYALVNGTFDRVFTLQAQGFSQEAARMQAHHVQTLELVRSANATTGNDRVEAAIRELAKVVQALGSRVQMLETEEEEAEAEAEAAAEAEAQKGPRQLSDVLLAKVAAAVEKYGEDALTKMAAKLLDSDG